MFARLITLVAACVAVCSCASTSVMTEQSLVELPIIQVALQDDWMGLSNARPAKHLLRKTYPAWLMAPDGPGFWRRGAVSQEDLNITIPPDLLEKLPSANKRSVSLMSIR
jgi:hypothetical protein